MEKYSPEQAEIQEKLNRLARIAIERSGFKPLPDYPRNVALDVPTPPLSEYELEKSQDIWQE